MNHNEIISEIINNAKDSNFKDLNTNIDIFIRKIGLVQYYNLKNNKELNQMSSELSILYGCENNYKNLKKDLIFFKEELKKELNGAEKEIVTYGWKAALKLIYDSININNLEESNLYIQVANNIFKTTLPSKCKSVDYIDDPKIFRFINDSDLVSEIKFHTSINPNYYFLDGEPSNGILYSSLYNINACILYSERIANLKKTGFNISLEMVSLLGDLIYNKYIDNNVNEISSLELNGIKSVKDIKKIKNTNGIKEIEDFKSSVFNNTPCYRNMDTRLFFSDSFALFIMTNLLSNLISNEVISPNFDILGLKIQAIMENPLDKIHNLAYFHKDFISKL